MNMVVDASVVLKWIFGNEPKEQDLDRAAALLVAIGEGNCGVNQPVHWCAEVLAVVARKSPARCDATQLLFESLAFPTLDDVSIYRSAARLSVDLNHHLFDTLYHAVALETGATLVTADERYFKVAKGLGAIQLLADFNV
jgi:predicted nucleic acid-binding protein